MSGTDLVQVDGGFVLRSAELNCQNAVTRICRALHGRVTMVVCALGNSAAVYMLLKLATAIVSRARRKSRSKSAKITADFLNRKIHRESTAPIHSHIVFNSPGPKAYEIGSYAEQRTYKPGRLIGCLMLSLKHDSGHFACTPPLILT